MKNHISVMIEKVISIAIDVIHFIGKLLQTQASLSAENIFLRKQLALYKERKQKPHRANNEERLVLVLLSKLFNWKNALVIVQPETFIKWHRTAFKRFWSLKCKRGRPSLSKDVRLLIKQMAKENSTWGEERIADELLLKIGLEVSPRTVRKHMPKSNGKGNSDNKPSQTWSTFIHNHMHQIIACDFMTVVSIHFKIYYVFVVIELGTRKIVHYNVTQHPNAQWAIQQFRETIHPDNEYKYLIHDNDSIFSKAVDRSVENMNVKVVKTAIHAPKMNAFCERVIGTIRRECLDHMIPLSEKHLHAILKQWIKYYNEGRPHMSLGPGIPNAPPDNIVPLSEHRHKIPDGYQVAKEPILGGLHHEYSFKKAA